MIFEYWNRLPTKACVHPDDEAAVELYKNIFEVQIPPGHVNGQLKKTPVIALFLNPGFEGEQEFENEECRNLLFEQIKGESDFPLWFDRWCKWFIPRMKIDGMAEAEIAKHVSVFNVCSYASRSAEKITSSVIRNIPSSQFAISYLHEVLIPQARKGERFIVVCRGAWAWKIDKSFECENIKFVNSPRGGHFGPEIRGLVKNWLERKAAKNT